ncbi:hypothetical protein [Flavonifractor sp. An100]|nr:hypothetical protein [Flavonifractor sp. An100]
MKKKYQSTSQILRKKVAVPFPQVENRKRQTVRPRPYHRRARRRQ